MRIKLDPRWTKMLQALPESGMGYQRVDLRLADGREIKDVPVFNAEEMDLPDGSPTVAIAELELHRA